MGLRPTPSAAIQAVLDDTGTGRWDDEAGTYRQARSDFKQAVRADDTLTDEQRDALLSRPRKRTLQLKATLHYYYGVMPADLVDELYD